MIGYLTGKIISSKPTQILLDVNGVGYEVRISINTFERISGKESISLFIYTNFKEDAITLFGFYSEAEKEMFELLISISGVGPKSALSLLSGISTDGLAVDPQQNYAVMAVEEATKHVDRWEVKPTAIIQYDLKAHKTIRTIPWPDNEEREFGNFKFSPDGKSLFIFGDDIVVYETSGFTQVDKWELSRPIEEGFGRLGLGALDDTYEEPGFITGIFTVRDAVQNRRIMGIARVNLLRKQVDFYALGPAQRVSFALAPDRKLAHGLFHEPGRSEFWTFDLVNRRLRERVPFGGPPRMGLKVSSNGTLLYIHVAGNTIDLYDASTHKYLRTITLDGDMTTDLYVLSRR